MKSLFKFIVRLSDFLRVRLRHIGISYDETKIPAYNLPDPLRLTHGGIVTRPKEWWKKRRPEIMRLFQDHVYGCSPRAPEPFQHHPASYNPRALGGLATRKEITLHLTDESQGPRLHLLVYLPNHVPKPVPAFLGLNFFGNHTIHPDPGICRTQQWQQPDRNAPPVLVLPSDETRGTSASKWPVEKILHHGYALATAYYGDLEPDFPGGWRYGIRNAFHIGPKAKRSSAQAQDRPPAERQNREEVGAPYWDPLQHWGAIGAWAWGLSRIMDYLESDTDIRASQVVLIGHSRLGKTALWAGAQDERFAIVISNNSGCGGAALFRRRFGETIKLLNQVRPHWFCKKFKKYNGKENQLPVDQHMLIALMAPRPVYMASAEQDLAADPQGEFLSAKHADPVYALYGLSGLGLEQMPGLNEPVGETVGYHIRSGKHDVTGYDWSQYLCFADRHLRTNAS